MQLESRNSNDTLKAFPLNYLATAAFYRHKFTYGRKSSVLQFSESISTVDRIAVQHDISLYHSNSVAIMNREGLS